MTFSERLNYAGANSLLIPVVLWGPKPLKSRVVRISSVQNGRMILTGSVDGTVMQWAVDEALGWIHPQMVLLAHECAISCISPICSSNTSKYVTCSEDGNVCLWDSIDGRVIESIKSNYVHRNIKPYLIKNGSQNILLCIGDYADVIVLHPFDLNVLFTLCSKVEPDWIASTALVYPGDKHDVLIGISMSGIIKLWSLNNIDTKDTGNVAFEHESKMLSTDCVKSIICSDKNFRMMLLVCGSSWQIIDPSNLNQLIISECAIEAVEGIIVDIDKVAIGFADSTIVLFQLPRRRQVRDKFGEHPTNVFNIGQPFVFALLKGSSPTPQRPSLSLVQFFFDESRNSTENRSNKRVAYRVDEQGSISLWNIPKNLDFLVNEFIRNRRPIVYEPTLKQNMSEAWARLNPSPPTLVETEENRIVTATIYVSTQGKLFHGRDDGSLMMMNACHAIMVQLLEGFNNDCAPFRLLSDGHNARVNCFVYPFDENPRYDSNLLLSGGDDFAVIVWNITLGERIHRFCCQGGPILRFIVPPANCSARVLNSICSIAGDNSAALMSLKELKCVLLASRQQFPIIDLRWRPIDDFLLLRCEDNSVYVWQIETANLDRIVAGLTTDEIMDACSEQTALFNTDAVDAETSASNTVQMLRALRHKNIAALRKIAGHSDGKQTEGALSPIELIRFPTPMDIVQLQNCSDKAHLVLFNIDALVAGLLSLDSELCSTESSNSNLSTNYDYPITDGRTLLNSLINKRMNVLHQDNDFYHKDPFYMEKETSPIGPLTTKVSASQNVSPTFLIQQQSLYMDTAKLLISLLHGWDFDEEIDRACLANLKLCRPKLPICFGTVTKKDWDLLLGNVSLYTPYCSGKISALDDFSFKYFSRNIHWHESRALTTVHLLAVIALSNSLMTLKSKSNQNAVVRPPLKRASSIKPADFLPESEGQLIKQGWSNVASLHCVLLPELIKPSNAYASPRIDLLARKWQDNCMEIRDAAQALLVQELTRLGNDGRRRLIERWANYLPTVLDSSISIFGTFRTPSTNAASASPQLQAQHHPVNNHHVAFVEVEESAVVSVPSSTSLPCSQSVNNTHSPSPSSSSLHIPSTVVTIVASSAISTATNSTNSTESTAKVPSSAPSKVPPIPPRTASSGALPSLVPIVSSPGDEEASSIWSRSCSLTSKNNFGGSIQHVAAIGSSPIESSLSSLEDPYQCAQSIAILNKLQDDQLLLCGGVQQVHRNQASAIVLLGVVGAEFPADLQRNIDLCRATAHSLLELLLAPESPLIPINSPLRRAAIDLLGRGFVVWQPHLDLSKTILGLLNLASESEKFDSSTLSFNSEPVASKTARHALSLIALARPQALITTLSTEVARYNAVAQHQTIQHTIPSPLMKARNDVLRLLEQLSDKQYNFVVDLIVPVGEILVHCLDLSQLKQRTLLEIFPSIARFYMVAYCPNTRRLAFGGKNGAIIVHELRASKAQTVQAHRAPITALAFSQDGKYLAAYAAQDAKISFWQTQQTFLGMGQSQIRCTKSVPAPGEFPVISPGGSYQPFRARLVWINSKSLTLMLPNGKENRFTI